jgi:hypothetical protein
MKYLFGLGAVGLIFIVLPLKTIASDSPQVHKLYVSHFGAVPDNNKDASQGIAAAMAYAQKNKIGTLYFSSGTYTINGPVNITASIVGEGKAVLKLGNNVNSYMLNVDGDNININNLNFDGNRANQSAPAFTENYAGFNKNNLIQSFHFFKNLHIWNCNFYNCQMGSIAFFSGRSASVLAAYPNKKPDGGAVRIPESLTIESCNFSNQGTQAVSVFFDYDFLTISNNKLIFPGSVKLLNCNFNNIGTFTPNQPYLNRFRQGDTFLCGGVSNLLVKHCNFTNSQRFDIKLGSINNVIVTDCTTHNPRWGFFQVQTGKISKQTLPCEIGNIDIAHNKFLFDLPQDSIAKTEDNIGLFVQLKGSIAKNVGLQDYYNNVAIDNNFIVYKGVNIKTWDCIQLNEYAKYKKVTISNNYVQDNRRGFISYIKPVIDNWQMDSLIIKKNVAFNESALVTDNSFFYAQGNSNNKIDNLVFQDNIALGYNFSVKSDADICNHLVINNNKFIAQSGHAISFVSPGNSFKNAVISGNYLSGDIQDSGHSGPGTIKSTGNIFNTADNIKNSSNNYTSTSNSVSGFKVKLSDINKHRVIAENVNDNALLTHVNKLISKGIIVKDQ